MLIVPKRPLPDGVEAGHYFQGTLMKNGHRVGNTPPLWRRLKDYGIIKVPPGAFEDDCLLSQGTGIMDTVNRPGGTGDGPSDDKYRAGMARILAAIETFRPRVVPFPYLKPLRHLVHAKWNMLPKLRYSFKTREDIVEEMTELRKGLSSR